MNCKNCGKELMEGSKFCSECGLQNQEAINSECEETETAVESAEEQNKESTTEPIIMSTQQSPQTMPIKKKSKKKRIIIISGVVFLLFILFVSTRCEHVFLDATCTDSAICELCGKEEGEPLGHFWSKATCIKPETCKRCGETQGESLGHKWEAATCVLPKTCSVCEETQGDALGHKVEEWNILKESTCEKEGIEKGYCSVCGTNVERSVKKLKHTMGEWKTIVAATCVKEGTEKRNCTMCNKAEERSVSKTRHTPGEWEVTTKATIGEEGEKQQKCTVCNKVLDTQSYEITQDEYKAMCKTYSYNEIARNPNKYKGELGKFYGRVIQVMEEDIYSFTSYTLRVALNGYDNVILVSYLADEDESHILEDDYITLYGELQGTYTYETVMGNDVTIPYVDAEFITIH